MISIWVIVSKSWCTVDRFQSLLWQVLGGGILWIQDAEWCLMFQEKCEKGDFDPVISKKLVDFCRELNQENTWRPKLKAFADFLVGELVPDDWAEVNWTSNVFLCKNSNIELNAFKIMIRENTVHLWQVGLTTASHMLGSIEVSYHLALCHTKMQGIPGPL